MNPIKIPAPLTPAQVIEGAVCAMLDELKIKVAIVPTVTGLIRDGWECDGWRVVFARVVPDKSKGTWETRTVCESFDYYTGTGHRVLPKNHHTRYLQNELKQKNTDTYKRRIKQDLEVFKIPVAPAIAGVLHSLMLDSSAQDESFNNWCSDFGYDQDSIKALNIYRACLENAEKMARIFSRTELASLSELLADY